MPQSMPREASSALCGIVPSGLVAILYLDHWKKDLTAIGNRGKIMSLSPRMVLIARGRSPKAINTTEGEDAYVS